MLNIRPFISSVMLAISAATSCYCSTLESTGLTCFSSRCEYFYNTTVVIHHSNRFRKFIELSRGRSVASDMKTVNHIFASRCPFKILTPIIVPNGVDVVNILFSERIWNKSFSNKSMHSKCFYRRFAGKANVCVPVFTYYRFFNSTADFSRPAKTAINIMVDAPYSTITAYLIKPFISAYVFPYLIHNDISCCCDNYRFACLGVNTFKINNGD